MRLLSSMLQTSPPFKLNRMSLLCLLCSHRDPWNIRWKAHLLHDLDVGKLLLPSHFLLGSGLLFLPLLDSYPVCCDLSAVRHASPLWFAARALVDQMVDLHIKMSKRT